MSAPQDSAPEAGSVPRRRLFQGAVGGAAAGALAVGGAWAVEGSRSSGMSDPADKDAIDLTTQYPLYDQAEPAGIRTPPQRYAIFMTFDMSAGTVATDLQSLLARWTAASAQLMAAQPIGQVQPTSDMAVGRDTGEALGLDAASLTVTIGLGPGLFDTRFGLAGKRPALLTPLPALPSDNLSAGTSGGDLSVQVCSDDPQVCYHAVRNLARMARDTVQTRWTVMGFGRASAGQGQQTPRNLLGFKDGTRNISEAADFATYVWLRDAGWMTGGTYQVVRKIEMNIETWDADRVSDQEKIFGRGKSAGEPLTGNKEFDTPQFAAQGKDGKPVIAPTSHIALAAHENNGGVKILRRSYNYTDGINEFGQLDAGLLFISYQNNPAHFVQLQRKLGAGDLLNEYIKHVGSGLFAIPPAPKAGHYIGEQLFAR
ncbi:Dyp-type peroxidase [Flexivirga caeni]|uniref:Dyp-type peroxidase n=1 Tax=Flexivirga caeni TaxID=2294115 RepID=A0A3M9LYT4_9MICO|nr:Dyp-type peroxidase [Flexivirga caeni]RNI17773.1 Dyp-type peroxidase [Flexivirga caeni]